MFDLKISGALIIDGSGSPPFLGDLAVEGGRIAAVGEVAGPAREVVNARGLALAPGIIDVHTHYDAQLTWDSYADPSPALGVTTVVIGNCGFTIAPCKPADRDLTMQNLTEVEGMSLDALRAGINWDFESFADFLTMLERRGVVPNVAAFVGHSSIRTYVLGADASRRAATDEEIAVMASIVRDAMAAGAVGFASSTNDPHNGANGIPMPSRLADEREFDALLGAMAERGRGIFMLTKGTSTSIPFLERRAERSGRPVMIAAMLHSDVDPEQVFDEMTQIDAARRRKHLLYGQVSCTPLTMDFTLEAPYLFGSLAAWKPALEADRDGRKRLYADSAFRAAVKAEIAGLKRRSLFSGQWAQVRVVEVADEQNRAFEGHSIAELAQRAGCDPLDYMLDLSLAEDLRTLLTADLLNSNESAVARLLKHPASNIALSDAGAHLTFLCEAGFGLHLLGHWSRELGALPLEEAIRKLTSEPAQIYGLPDRGILRVGAQADLLLFDPKTVARGAKQRVYDLPAGAPRLTTPAVGLHGVWVNGVQVANERGLIRSDARPGKIIREFAAASAPAVSVSL